MVHTGRVWDMHNVLPKMAVCQTVHHWWVFLASHTPLAEFCTIIALKLIKRLFAIWRVGGCVIIDSIAVLVFEVILVEFYKYWIQNLRRAGLSMLSQWIFSNFQRIYEPIFSPLSVSPLIEFSNRSLRVLLCHFLFPLASDFLLHQMCK